MNEGSRRAIVAAFVENLGIALAKLVAFLATGAASMLAEAVHSLADTGNLHLGPEELLVVAKVDFDPSFALEQLARSIDRAEARIRERVPEARLIFLEPDLHRDPEVPARPDVAS
jgi:divalent metal cation (Fe/Co/Zn/Cd) transporter